MIEAATLPNTELQETCSEILLKILSGEYWLLRREERSTVWHMYRQIIRSDGTKLRGQFFCTGCKRLMISRDTSGLRSHICHVKYLQWRAANSAKDVKPRQARQKSGHRIHWSWTATKTLLQLWEDNIECLRTGDDRIFRKIAKEMNHLGLKPSDIKTKMDHMSENFRREAEREKVTGRLSKWPHFHEVQKLVMEVDESYRNSINVESNSPQDMKTDGSIEQNNDYDEKFQVDLDMEELNSLETYEEELDQQHWQPEEDMYRAAQRRKDKRIIAIQKERLALEKENSKTFEILMNEMLLYHKTLYTLLSCND